MNKLSPVSLMAEQIAALGNTHIEQFPAQPITADKPCLDLIFVLIEGVDRSASDLAFDPSTNKLKWTELGRKKSLECPLGWQGDELYPNERVAIEEVFSGPAVRVRYLADDSKRIAYVPQGVTVPPKGKQPARTLPVWLARPERLIVRRRWHQFINTITEADAKRTGVAPVTIFIKPDEADAEVEAKKTADERVGKPVDSYLEGFKGLWNTAYAPTHQWDKANWLCWGAEVERRIED